MTLECFKGKGGRDIYYFEGKRITKREAKMMNGGKLPSCIKKTSENQIKSLKKRIKDILGGRNEYKARLEECDVVRGRYNELVSLIESARGSVDVMNRVCLTQDVKRQMDEEYTRILNTLNESNLRVGELESANEQNRGHMRDLQSMLEEMNARTESMREEFRREREEGDAIRRNLDALTRECSDRPALLDTIEELRFQIRNYNDRVEELGNELTEKNNLNDEMRDRLNALEDNLNSVNRLYEEEMKRANDALNTVERMNVNIDRYEDEIKTLQAENDTLRESVAGNQSLQDTIYSLQGQLDDRIREFYERRNEMEATLRQYSDRYVTDVNAAEERVAELEDQLELEREECKEENGRLALEVDSLNNVRSRIEQSLREEKEKCLEEVQRAIDGERELSKREARAYEERLAELNYKLIVCEETREELEKIKAGGNMSEVKMSKKQLKKAQKKLEKAI